MWFVPPQEFPIIRLKRFGTLPFGWRRTPNRVLIFGDRYVGAISIETTGQAEQLIPLESIIKLELATVLLRAHFKLTWMNGGQAEALRIEFNAVGDSFVREELNYLRAVIAERTGLVTTDHPMTTGPRVSGLVEAALTEYPLKFSNYLHYALIRGERILFTQYQPAIRQSLQMLRGYFSPNRALAITNYHLILVEEERTNLKGNYSVVTVVCPRQCIHHVSFEVEAGMKWTWVRFALGEAVSESDIRIPLLPEQAARLQEAVKTMPLVPVSARDVTFYSSSASVLTSV